jgi:hypothetical protein
LLYCNESQRRKPLDFDSRNFPPRFPIPDHATPRRISLNESGPQKHTFAKASSFVFSEQFHTPLAFPPFFVKFSVVKPYEELIQFIASLSPRDVIDFKPSEPARQRVWELIERKKTSPLPADENSELDQYLEIEHIMRLAKARARQLLTHGQ